MKEQDLKKTFKNFHLKGPLLQAIDDMGFTAPTPIQEQVIPLILSGQDVIAQAQTGTGKTAGFGLPCLNKIDIRSGVSLLVITPTRELAQQVSDELSRYASLLGIRTVTVYGGQSITRQIDQIRRGTQVVVATPGRLLDLLQSNKLQQFAPSMVVLDEADEMLDMGFLEDIQKIFSFLPAERQTLLFSATMPVPIQKLANKILKDPSFIKVTKNEVTNTDIKQIYYVIKEQERDDALVRLIDSQEPTKSIVFCGTKKEVDRISHKLAGLGHGAQGLHGDMEQYQRQQVIEAFRRGDTNILVATDVAARGLNVPNISHVFNYHIPFEAQNYVHRIGRTGRAGKKGIAISLLTQKEVRVLQQILKMHGTQIEMGMMPTLEDVKKIHSKKLIGEVRDQSLHTEAKDILAAMQNEMDLNTIALNLVSMLLERQKIAGPSKIGLDRQEAERVLKGSKSDNQFTRSKSRRPRPPFSKRKTVR